MEKVKKRNILLVILITIFVGCLIGGGLYLYKDKENNKPIEKPNTEQKQNEEGNAKQVTVKDAVNYVDSYYDMFYVKLPKIVGNTDAIEKLNTNILNEVLSRAWELLHIMQGKKDIMIKGQNLHISIL